MKRLAILTTTAAALICLSSCNNTPVEPKVMARYVPERADDFVWENDLICYRAYGQALEGNPTSPGFDVWVKLPGKLVANDWYEHACAMGDENYYHHDHGGKDCYKVSVSLGAGASAPLIDGQLHMPPTNYRSYDILEDTPEKAVFVLHYPEWEVAKGVMVALDKKITVTAGSYFCNAEDSYTGNFSDLTVAAGIFLHGECENAHSSDSYAIWEPASDQSQEAEDGMLGIAVYMPGADAQFVMTQGEDPANGKQHAVLTKTIKPGETVSYLFGSCWSKGDIKTAEDWFSLVEGLK